MGNLKGLFNELKKGCEMLRTVNKLLCCKTSILSWFYIGLNCAGSYIREAGLIHCIKHCNTSSGPNPAPLTLLQSDNNLPQKSEMQELH